MHSDLEKSVNTEMKAFDEEIKLYNNFALNLARGADCIDCNTYDVIIDSRRKELIDLCFSNAFKTVFPLICGLFQLLIQ